jgi:hypothetical protein
MDSAEGAAGGAPGGFVCAGARHASRRMANRDFMASQI